MKRVIAACLFALAGFLAPTGRFTAGASGYFLQDISADGLLHSLRLVNSGENVFPSALASALSSAAKLGGHVDTADELSSLHATDLEIDILKCIATGETNSDIRKKLGISESEVSVHIKHILRKLRVSNRTQAALWAVAKGLATTPFSALTRLSRNGEGEEPRPNRKRHPASSQHGD
jgi:two-component system nitrate/nitrite response regulator NarL